VNGIEELDVWHVPSQELLHVQQLHLRERVRAVVLKFIVKNIQNLLNSHRMLIDTYSQFHQYFTSSFCADILAPKKLQSQTVIREKLHKALLYKKALVKC